MQRSLAARQRQRGEGQRRRDGDKSKSKQQLAMLAAERDAFPQIKFTLWFPFSHSTSLYCYFFFIKPNAFIPNNTSLLWQQSLAFGSERQQLCCAQTLASQLATVISAHKSNALSKGLKCHCSEM